MLSYPFFMGRGEDMAWAEEEFAGADLGDKRLNRRLIKLTERFADKPTASIPGGLCRLERNGWHLSIF
ncbi:MAG: transposase [Rhodocyclaceae bacterium]|nr:transposase [Rhodocyclaceae bacterium]